MPVNFPDEQAAVCEVAVDAGKVVINYQSTVGRGEWGHLSFTTQEADALIKALQDARKQAAKGRH